MSYYTEAVQQWISDWSKKFDQDWDADKLRALLGKNVELHRPTETDDEGEEIKEIRIFKFQITGWSCDHLEDEDGTNANKWSVLTDEGNQIALLAGSRVEVIE